MGKSLMRPGFRFKPTDVELAMYYLKKKLLNIKLDPEVIAEINLNDFSPWDLPAKSILTGDLEWYFFYPIPKKYPSRPRSDRATKTGVWRGSGKDKEINHKGKTVAMRKTLIFYISHVSKENRTNWVIHEYQMKDEDLANLGVAQDAYVVCRVFEKSDVGPKNGEQYGAPFEEEEDDDDDDDDDVTSIMTVGVLVNPNNFRCSNVKNITSTESGPSTVTSSAVVGVSRVTKETVDPNNAITSLEKERLPVPDVLVDDDVMLMLTHGDLSSLLCDTDNAQVEDAQGEKVMSDDGLAIFQELMAKSNLEDLGMCSVDWTMDAFLPDDFLLFPEDD